MTTSGRGEATRKKGGRLGLRLKLLVGWCGAALMIIGVLTTVLVTQARDALVHQLWEEAHAVSHLLSNNPAFASAKKDAASLRSTTATMMAESAELAYIVFREKDGSIVTMTRSAALSDAAARAIEAPRFTADEIHVQRELELGGMQILEIAERSQLEVQEGEAPAAHGHDVAASATDHRGARGRFVDVGTVQVGFRGEILDARVWAITRRALVVSAFVFLLCVIGALLFARRIAVPVERLTAVAASVAQGDLRHEVDARGKDEIGELARSFRTMSTGLREMASDLQQAAAEIRSEAGEILSTAAQQASMASQQATAITETSTTVTEIAQTSRQATEHADGVIQVAQKSEELSREGERSVEQAKQGIEAVEEQVRAIAGTITRLAERTHQIGEIISTVKDVAEQSNILALNAAIEASKAGEHGRGFAVVATEMRNLAEQSKVAASQVRVLLGEIQSSTREAVDATDEGSRRAQAAMTLAHTAGEAIVGLSQVIRESSLAARQIANNTRQQTIGVDQIVAAIAELSGAMNESVTGTRSIERVTTNLDSVSKRLAEMVSRYRI